MTSPVTKYHSSRCRRLHPRLLPRFLLALLLLVMLPGGCGFEHGEPAADESLGSILRVADPRERAARLLDYFQTARPDDLPAIRLAYEEGRSYLDGIAGSVLALWWAGHDPAAAYTQGLQAAWIESSVWATTVLREWARLDPEAALAKVREVNQAGADENWIRTLSLALVRGWFDGDRDPLPLLDLARTLPIGRPQKELLDVIFYRTMERSGWPKVIEMAEGLPDLEDRNFKRDAYKRLATVLAAEAPELAVEWTARHHDGPYGEHLWRRVGRRWAHDDGKAALGWAMALPESEEKARVVLEAFRGWNNADVDAAARWIDAQEWSPLIEAPLKLSVLARAQRRDPALAMARVQSLPESELRSRLIEDVGRVWLRKDAGAAEAWLAEQALPSEVERAIRSLGPRMVRPGAGAQIQRPRRAGS